MKSFKQELRYGFFVRRDKKSDRCRDPLVEVRLYIFSLVYIHEHCPVLNTSNAWKVCLVQLFEE